MSESIMRTLYIKPSTYARMANLNLNLKRTYFFFTFKRIILKFQDKDKEQRGKNGLQL